MEARRLTVLLTLLLLASTFTAIAPVEGQTSYELKLKYVELVLNPLLASIEKDAVIRVLIPLPKNPFSGCSFKVNYLLSQVVPAYLLNCYDGDSEIRLYPQQTWVSASTPGSGWDTSLTYAGSEFKLGGSGAAVVTSIYHYSGTSSQDYPVIGRGSTLGLSSTAYVRMLVNVPLDVQATLLQTWVGTVSTVKVNGVAYGGSQSSGNAVASRTFQVTLNKGLNLIAFSVTGSDVNGDSYTDLRAEVQLRFKLPGYWLADTLIRVPASVQAGGMLRLEILPASAPPRDGTVFKYWWDDFNVWDSSKYTITVSAGTPSISASDGWLVLGTASAGTTATYRILPNLGSWPTQYIVLMRGMKAPSWIGYYLEGIGDFTVITGDSSVYSGLWLETSWVKSVWATPAVGISTAPNSQAFIFGLNVVNTQAHFQLDMFFSNSQANTRAVLLNQFFTNTFATFTTSIYFSGANNYVYIDWIGVGKAPPIDYRGWQHYCDEVKTITFSTSTIQTAEGVKNTLKITFNTTIYGGDVYQGATKFENGLLANGSATVFPTRSAFLAQVKHNASFRLLVGTLADGSFNVLETLELQGSTLRLLETSVVLALNNAGKQGYTQLVVAGSTRRLVHISDTVNYAEATLEAKLFNAILAGQGALEVLVMMGPYPTFRGQGLLALEIEGVDGAGRSLKLFTYDGKYTTSGYDIEPQPETIVFAYPFVYPVSAKVTYYLDMTTGLGFILTVPAIKYAPVTWTYNVSAPAGANWLVEGLAGFLNNLPLPGDYKPYIAYAVVLATLLTVPVLPPAVALILAVFLVIVFMAAGWISLSGGWLALLALIVVVAFLMYRQKVYPY